jgi:hypothetical protein
MSRYCFHIHHVVLLFMLLGFPFHVVAFLFSYSFISCARFFTLLLVYCYWLKNLVLPPCIPSCKN